MSIFDRALHIPAETRLSDQRARGLPRVLLPLRARVTWRVGLVGVMAAALSVACLSLALAFASSPENSADGAFKWSLTFFFFASGLLPAAVALTALRDMLRGGFCLVVDGEGIRDTRLCPAVIAWSTIAKAALVSTVSGPNAVLLSLKAEGAPIFDPCRAGGWSARWTLRRSERTIALLLLDQRPYVLAQTILVLASRNGVIIEQTSSDLLSRL